MNRTPDNDSTHDGHIRLACQACQRKKIKCDRTFPCGQCTKSSLNCVASSRKQRVRHAGKRAVDGELRSRIAKLESLVQSLSSDPTAPQDKPTGGTETTSSPSRTSSEDIGSPVLGKYIANNFWCSLTREVGALREALEEVDEDESLADTSEMHVSSPDKPSLDWTIDHDLLVCPPGRIFVMPGVLEDPEPRLQQCLIDVFFQNAEPVLKVFHRPTLRAAVEHNADYLGHPPGSIEHDTLRRLIWLAAYNTLSEAEVLSLTGRSKLETIMRYRRYVGISLSQIDLMNTGDLATLQSLMFFITVCRSTDRSRRTWTSLALLVRNAQAVYMNQDDPNATPFIRELRKRLWHNIRLLDKFCALDRGSSQLIRKEEFSIPFPTNTNDDLFGPDSVTIPELHGYGTDMSFPLTCFEACDTIEALIIPETEPTGPTWEERRQLAIDMGVDLQERYLKYCDLSIPFQRVQHAVGKCIITAMVVRAVRPMQRHLSSVPPPANSPEVLLMAVECLEASYAMASDSEAAPWKWMKWVPWHPLAVALAGLCSIRDTPLAARAWKLVEPTCKFCSQHIADGEDGMLWRPVIKLYKKAAAFRDAAVTARRGAESRPSIASSGTISSTEMGTWPVGNGLAASSLSSNTDQLSQDLSSLAPFAAASSSAAYPPGKLSMAETTSLTPIVFSDIDFNDTSWTDWGQMMDEFNDPLATGNMDMSMMMMSDWNVDGNVPHV